MKASRRRVAVLAILGVAVGALAYAAFQSVAPSTGLDCAGVQTSATGVLRAAHASDPPRPVAMKAGSGVEGPGPAGPPASPRPAATGSGPIPIVAAENFWGSLLSQLGGNRTSVLSIVNDPNADPHEYEANTSDAIAITNARLIVVNGVGYDDWALQLIAAEHATNQTVLNIGTLNGVTVGAGAVTGNPHMWYSPGYVNATVAAMFSDLVAIAPGQFAYFQGNYAALNASLGSLYGEATAIKAHFGGSVVAATEDIFVYLANFTGLDLISPPAFMQAVAEGNDPPVQSVVAFECQLDAGHVRVLLYNEQTITTITDNMRALAAAHNVTIVGMTETIQPPGMTFQAWMGGQYRALYGALTAAPRGP